jgi:hypothetical protein
MGRPIGKTEDRFWKYTDRKESFECWLWKGATHFGKYGKLWDGNRTISAHRYIWEVTRKCKIPEGMEILHLCDNDLCVNPDHLYCGTQKDNMRDRFKRNRVNLASFAKPRFYEGEVWLMKKLYKAGLSQSCIALMFRANQSTISKWLSNEFKFCKSLNGGTVKCPK